MIRLDPTRFAIENRRSREQFIFCWQCNDVMDIEWHILWAAEDGDEEITPVCCSVHKVTVWIGDNVGHETPWEKLTEVERREFAKGFWTRWETDSEFREAVNVAAGEAMIQEGEWP